MKLKVTLLLALFALAAFAVGCGGGGATLSDVNTDVQQPTEQSDDSGEAEETKSSGKTKQPTVSGELGEKPEISDASGDPPGELVKKDIKAGSGKAAKEGDTVKVQYVGHNWSDNKEFDASWGRGDPFEFTLGEGQVIQGWDQGVVDMKEGGRRLLIIPPDLGYGNQGQGEIPANETLIFVVDLESIG